MVFGACASFARVGREKPGYVLGLDERCAVEHHASQEVRKQIVVSGEVCKWFGPEIWGCGCQRVAFQDSDGTGRIQFKEPELAEIGDEDQPVLAEIADGLRLRGESIEVVVGWLDFYDATLGVLERFGFDAAALPFGPGKEPAVGDARSAIAELSGEQDRGPEGLTDGIEKTVEGRVEGGFGGCRARGADDTNNCAMYWSTV